MSGSTDQRRAAAESAGEESFSAQVKAELCREKMTRPCCALAESYGLLLFCNTFQRGEVRLVTTSPALAQRIPRLFRRALDIRFDRAPRDAEAGGQLVFQLTDQAKLARVLEAYGQGPEELVNHHVNYALLEENCCRAAFLRGAFLAGGSVTDPRKRYHLEFTTSHYYVARELGPMMAELELYPKTSVRKSNYVTYFKQSEAISDFLTTIGAPLAAMDVMNAKLEKNLRNRVNRRSNCDVANVDKAVAAAQGQIAVIRRLQSAPVWETLPDALRETAERRVDNPDLSLHELADLLGVSKSCLNHRLRRLQALEQAQH
ncbi:MAG TPA: DNA-binding protein WhiA [Candidatus Onthomonas avicola]|nr:DNA-binding protein WhiA [Candidatus Onthomonas avicola]